MSEVRYCQPSDTGSSKRRLRNGNETQAVYSEGSCQLQEAAAWAFGDKARLCQVAYNSPGTKCAKEKQTLHRCLQIGGPRHQNSLVPTYH